MKKKEFTFEGFVEEVLKKDKKLLALHKALRVLEKKSPIIGVVISDDIREQGIMAVFDDETQTRITDMNLAVYHRRKEICEEFNQDRGGI